MDRETNAICKLFWDDLHDLVKTMKEIEKQLDFIGNQLVGLQNR